MQAAGKNAREVEIKIESRITALIETYIPEMKVAEEKEDRCEVRGREEEEGRVRAREERPGRWWSQAVDGPGLGLVLPRLDNGRIWDFVAATAESRLRRRWSWKQTPCRPAVR